MQWRAVGLASIAFAWSVMAPAAARAGEEGFAFSWEAPEGCPSSSDMEGRIRARVKSGSGWTVRGRVHREASGFRVQLTTPSGERVLTASTCDQAADAAVVIVALAVDGAAVGGPTAAPEAVPRDKPRMHAPVDAGPPERPWGVSIGGAVDTSSLPAPSPGIGAGLAFGAGVLSLHLEVTGFLAQTKRASGDPPVSAGVALVDAMVIGCVTGRLAASPFDAGACAGGGFGLLPAESDGITSPKASIGVRPEALLALRVGWHWSDDLVLRIQAGPLLDPARPAFRVEGVGDVYRPPLLTFRGSVGVEMRFR